MEIIDPKTILEQGKMFYKNLYTEVHCNDSNYKLFFENSNIAKLEAMQQEELECPLLNEECFLILKQCSKNKTVEFLNLFKLLSKFQECSGLEINKSKTEGM